VEGEWTIPQLKARLTDYHEEHGMIRLDPEARSTKFFRKEGDKVEQMLVDDQELNDWQVVLEVDFAKSDEEERVVLDLVELGPLV
jgi:hypothetical protein